MKLSKTGATRCQILRQKCIKFDFRWGSDSDPLAVFMGLTCKVTMGSGIANMEQMEQLPTPSPGRPRATYVIRTNSRFCSEKGKGVQLLNGYSI